MATADEDRKEEAMLIASNSLYAWLQKNLSKRDFKYLKGYTVTEGISTNQHTYKFLASGEFERTRGVTRRKKISTLDVSIDILVDKNTFEVMIKLRYATANGEAFQEARKKIYAAHGNDMSWQYA